MEFGSPLTHNNVSRNDFLSNSLSTLKNTRTLRISSNPDILDWNHARSTSFLPTDYAQIDKTLGGHAKVITTCLGVQQNTELWSISQHAVEATFCEFGKSTSSRIGDPTESYFYKCTSLAEMIIQCTTNTLPQRFVRSRRVFSFKPNTNLAKPGLGEVLLRNI